MSTPEYFERETNERNPYRATRFSSIGGGRNCCVRGSHIPGTRANESQRHRWRSEFVAIGKARAGGSGWVILTYCPRHRRLANAWAADHTTTIAGGDPVLVLDMYEHSYQMDFGARAADYVNTVMSAINWSNADRLYAQYSRA